MFCCGDYVSYGSEGVYQITAIGKIEPTILKVGEKDNKIKVKIEENPIIIRDITTKILEKDDKELLKKITEEN